MLFLLMWLRVISDKELNKCSAVHQLHKSNLSVWLRISIFHQLVLQGRMVKNETFHPLTHIFQFTLHCFKIHFSPPPKHTMKKRDKDATCLPQV